MSEQRENTHGPYRLLRRIGVGGMAEVFEAERVDGTGPRVALKRVLPAHAGDGDFERMFADEITIAQQIRDEHILSVIDADRTPPAQYLALELVDGTDGALIQRAVRNGDALLSTSAIAWIGACVARGLHAAHEARDERGRAMEVVHRDVSPSNVFVTREGAIKLGDFGVAFARERSAKTVTGVVKGKVAFMAPEQLSGLAFDRRADIFALACTLHAIAVGESPVRAMDDLIRVLREGSITLDDAVPDDLREPLGRALRAEPAQRFETALAFGDALARLCLDEAAARAELSSLCDSLRAQSPSRPKFDALWSLDAMGLDEAQPEPVPIETPRAAPSPPAATPVVLARPSRSRAILASLAALVAVSTVVLAVRARNAPAPTITRPSQSERDAGLAITAIPAQRAAQDPAFTDASTVAATMAPIAANRRNVTRRTAHDAGAHIEAPRPENSTTVATNTAWVSVGFTGAAMRGAKVFVDGVERGWAPARVNVSVGRRRIVVRDSEGHNVLDELVSVGDEHTRISPRIVLVRSISP